MARIFAAANDANFIDKIIDNRPLSMPGWDDAIFRRGDPMCWVRYPTMDSMIRCKDSHYRRLLTQPVGDTGYDEEHVVPRKVNANPGADIWEPVAAALQNDIIFGRLQPREHLVEDDIIARFDITRYAVRRALAELDTIGLVERAPNRGTRVKGYSLDEVVGLFEVRELLEQHAVRRMPSQVNPKLIARLTKIQERHEKVSANGRLVEMFHLNNEFHETLYEACGNPVVAQSIKLYTTQTAPIRMRLFPDAERRKQVVSEHWQMIDALRHDDRDLLCALIRRHMKPTKEAAIQLASPPAYVDA